ncbi:MAG TPA: tetratricopeptide repeat protein [Pirellulales bacterium]|jgi:tetratricopeptide (TPR) repeat protein
MTIPVISPAEATSPAAATRRGWQTWRPLVVFVLLGAAVVAVYGGTTHAPFVFDDVPCIENNPSIMHLWPPLGTKEEPGPLRPPQDFNTAGRPLVNLSFALNVAFDRIEGIKVDPFGFHVCNMLLHALTATLLWALVRRTLCLDFFAGRFERVASPLAFLVALVWALHPLQTEAVQYVSQRTELMMGFFYLAVMYGSLRYFTAENSASQTNWLVLTTLAGLAGMACKEVMVSAPAMVLLYDRTFIAGSFLRALRKSWPLYLGLLLGWILLLALNVGGPRSASAGFHLNVAPHVWWLTQCRVLWLYLKLVVWPWPLVIHYEFPYLQTLSAAWPWALGVAGLAILTLLLVWRRAAAGFLCVWVIAILSPTLVVPIITEIAVERRMYLPLLAPVAFFIVGGYALLQVLAGWRTARADQTSKIRWPLVAIAGVAITCATVYAMLDVRRLAAYEDPLTLWEDAHAHQPENYYVHVNYGVELLNQGRAEEALQQLKMALKIDPSDAAHIHAVMGKAHLLAKRPAEAKRQLEEALRLQPDFPEARGNLGHVLLHEYNDIAGATPYLEESLRKRPDSLEIRHDLALVLINTGRSAEAIDWLEPVVRLKPESSEAHRDMGLALGNVGRAPEAISQFEEALRLNPHSALIHQYLGMALINVGKNQSAIEQLERSLELDPRLADAHYYLGFAHFNAGRPRDAISEFEKALALQPDHAGAKIGLERARAAQPGQ